MTKRDVILVLLMVVSFIISAKTLDPAILMDLAVPIRVLGEGCGYENCPTASPDELNVHIVPHTHFEMGYWASFDQHFEGTWEDYKHRTKTKISMRKVLDAVVTELWNNKERRFTLADTSYFFQWWKQRDPTVHRMVYELVRQNRLSFVGGGWSMSDETSTNYQAIIDSHTYGLGKLNATFLDCGRPLVAWQADSYGHSKEFASLMALMGYDGLFIAPISFDEEIQRMLKMSLEFLWRGNDDLGVESDMFTHKLFDGFNAPPGFCFSVLCDDPLLADSSDFFENIGERLKAFGHSIQYRQSPYYRTQNVLLIMGNRLGYFDAEFWFKNLDKLIPYAGSLSVENGTRIRAFYSTPACYLKAVHESKPTLPLEQNDFMPYRFNRNSYATGMYTSMPSLKWQVVEANAYLQISKQIQVLARLRNVDGMIDDLKWIMGIVQDHSIMPGLLTDAATGYYTQKIYLAVQWATHTMKMGFDYFRGSNSSSEYFRCSFNESICINFNNTRATILVYNPLGWPVTIPVRLPIVQGTLLDIYDHNGNRVTASVMKTPDPIRSLNKHHYFNYTHEVVFIANDIPPLGFKAYYSKYKSPTTKRRKRALIKVQRRRTLEDTKRIYNNDPMEVEKFDIPHLAFIKTHRPKTYKDNKRVYNNKDRIKVKRYDIGPGMPKDIDYHLNDDITDKPSVTEAFAEINKSRTDVTRMKEFVLDTNVDEDFDKGLRNEIEFREMAYDEIYSTPTKRPKIPFPKREPTIKDKDIDIKEGIESYVGDYLSNIATTNSYDVLMNKNVAEVDTIKSVVNMTDEISKSISTSTENEGVVLDEFVNNTDNVGNTVTTERIGVLTVEIEKPVENTIKRVDYPKWIDTDKDFFLRAGTYDKNKSKTTTAITPQLPVENENESAFENFTQVPPKEIEEIMELDVTTKEYNSLTNITNYKWDVTTTTEKSSIRIFSSDKFLPINETLEQITTESEVITVLEKSTDSSELVTDIIDGPNRETIKHDSTFVMPLTTEIVNISKPSTTENVNNFIPILENSNFSAVITTENLQVIPVLTSTEKILFVNTNTKNVSESFIPERTTTKHVLLPVLENTNYEHFVNKTAIRKYNVIGANETTEQLEFGNMAKTENTDTPEQTFITTTEEKLSDYLLSNNTSSAAHAQTTNNDNETVTRNNDNILNLTPTENIYDVVSTTTENNTDVAYKKDLSEKLELEKNVDDDDLEQTVITSIDETSSFKSILNDSTMNTGNGQTTDDNTEERLNIKSFDENENSLIQTTEFILLPIFQNIPYAPETTTEFDQITVNIGIFNQSTTDNEFYVTSITTGKNTDSTTDISEQTVITSTSSIEYESDVVSTDKNHIDNVTDIKDTAETKEYELEFIATNENFTGNLTDYDIPVTTEREFDLLTITTENYTSITEQLDLKTKVSSDIPEQTISTFIEDKSNKYFSNDTMDTIIINTEETGLEETKTENGLYYNIVENSTNAPDYKNTCNNTTDNTNCSNQTITAKDSDITNERNDIENVDMPEQTLITSIVNKSTNAFTNDNNIQRHDLESRYKSVPDVPLRSTSNYDFISKQQKNNDVQATRKKIDEIMYHGFEDDVQSLETEAVTDTPDENPTTYSGLLFPIFNVSNSGKGGTVFHREKGMSEKEIKKLKAKKAKEEIERRARIDKEALERNKLNAKKAKEEIERRSRIDKEALERKNKAAKAKEEWNEMELKAKAKAYDYSKSYDDFIENQHIKITIDRKTHKITSMHLNGGITVALDIQYYYYEPDVPDPNMPVVDDNPYDGPGPHIFRTRNNQPIAILNSVKTEVYKNVLVQEIHTVFSDYTSFAVRLYNDSATLELDWLVGPVPGEGTLGKEVFIRYKTDLVNAGVFYTDSNGRQMMKRIRHSAASVEDFDRVAGNIYPVTSKISIEDTERNLRLSVFNDRSQGGTSLHDGEIDLMLHRRVLFSNQQLLDERDSKNKPIIVRGKHYIHLGKASHKPNKIYENRLVKEISLMPKITAGSFKGNLKSWLKLKNRVKGLKRKLPIGVHLLTLEKWNFNTLLIRFENYLEISDVMFHNIKTVYVEDLFIGVRIKSMKEATLGANKWIEDWGPLRWNKEGKFFKKFKEVYGTMDNVNFDEVDELKPLQSDFMENGVQLAPQQIRTFVAVFEYV